MVNTTQPAQPAVAREGPVPDRATPAAVACHHCGLECREPRWRRDDRMFCCQGCLTVFELLTENGLESFYELGRAAGMNFQRPAAGAQFGYLDDPALRARLVQFDSPRLTRVTFRLPAIHCVACVWLLENLPRFDAALLEARVSFPRKEVAVAFDPRQLKLSELVSLLAAVGYPPDLRLDALDRPPVSTVSRRIWLQLGLAGFAFGNIMLFSLPGYFGLDAFSAPVFSKLFGWFSLVLALPVFLYSAADYWRSAWTGLRQRQLTIEVPIVLGLLAIMARSVHEVVTGAGVGYFDTLTGLLFFLLIGRVFQQKTYDRLSFERDYRSFFPLAVTRKEGRDNAGGQSVRETRVSLEQLAVGDRLIVRNGELIPADAVLIAGPALIDYSFVTGESDPVARSASEPVYAGGRQLGGAIELELTRRVNQSYLTSLWNQAAFQKVERSPLDTLINRFSRHFTPAVLAIAAAAAGWWLGAGESARAGRAFVSVLIVACPCALALATPFTLGTALRLLGRRRIFLKGAQVIEALARIDTVVFDKTGTLTVSGAGAIRFLGPTLSEAEERWLYSLTRHSTHPHAVRIGEAIARNHFPEPVRSFLETPGQGMEARVAGREVWMGSAAWLTQRGAGPDASETSANPPEASAGSEVHVAVDGRYRGRFVIGAELRPKVSGMIQRLRDRVRLALLSGDHPRERGRFLRLFGAGPELHFNQSPGGKLEFIHGLQRSGRRVLMVGDGLNDAGALRQSDVGLAVVDEIGAFSPASDGIIAAPNVAALAGILEYARASVRVVKLGLGISAAYNVIGLTLAVQGLLSPVFCAIVMPLSSVTVVACSTGLAAWLARRHLPASEVSP